MRHLPGWVVGALGTAAIVAAFYAGGTLGASNPSSLTSAEAAAAAAPVAASADAAALEVECEPGQRAVVRPASATAAGSVACVSRAAGPALNYAANSIPATSVAYAPQGGYVRPAVINEPIEVYRPRAIPVSYEGRDVARPTRSVKKSVAIIAGSTAVGATIGGLTKGKKGAVIGGIVGGGAATVWDQVTRRRDTGR